MGSPLMPYGDSRRNATVIRAWRQANPDACLAANKRSRDKLRLATLIAYSTDPPKCACCKEGILEFLTLDHIAGGGGSDRRRRKERGGHKTYLRLRRAGFPQGFRVLCWNCNAAIGLYGGCPHGGVRNVAPVRKLYVQAKKLTIRKVRRMRQRIAAGVRQNVLAREYGVSAATVCAIAKNQIWREPPSKGSA